MKYKDAILVFFFVSSATVFADITCTFHLGGVDSGIRSQIESSVTEAVQLYNKHGSFNKHLNVYYSAGVPTAQASYNGTITFGGSRNTRVALHEIAHTLGIGQTWEYGNLMSGSVWQGEYGYNLAVEMGSPYSDGIHGDSVHFWPWGLNYDSEDGFAERIKHIQIVATMRCDMIDLSGSPGLMAYLKDPEHQIVPETDTAIFSVETPLSYDSYQWYKDGSPLSSGGDISGASSRTLHIANADESDEGVYHCVSNYQSEALESRGRKLILEKFVGRWNFNGDASDSVGSGDGTITGSPSYTAGKTGEAIVLDGVNDYITLPAEIVCAEDITIAAWVYWNGGGSWQRVFDFGNSTSQYLFLTPSSYNNTLRFAIKDGIQNNGDEEIVETSRLAVGQWVHLSVVLENDIATLYVNGQAAASNNSVTIDPKDFAADRNYIGNSQWSADPLFDGRIDDFRIYNYALDGQEIQDLWASGSPAAPVNLTASVKSGGANLDWDDNTETDITGYNVYRNTCPEGDYTQIASEVSSSEYTDDSIEGDVRYYYTVTAVDEMDNESDYSEKTTVFHFAGDLDYNERVDIKDLSVLSSGWGDIYNIDNLKGLAGNWLEGTSGLSACWKLDADASESSGRLLDGQVYGSPQWVSGRVDGAIELDGVDDYIYIPVFKGITGTSSRTCTGWIKTAQAPGHIMNWGLVETGEKWVIRLNSDGTLRAEVQGGYMYGTTSLDDGRWHHIAVVLKEDDNTNITDVRLYVDGEQETIGDYSSQQIDTASGYDVKIGKHISNEVYFDGLIDDVRIYNRALSNEQIQELYE